MAEAGTKPEKKEIRNYARWPKVCGSWRNQATEEGEIRLQNRPTSSMHDSEVKGMRLPRKSGWVTPAAAPHLPPRAGAQPHLSC